MSNITNNRWGAAIQNNPTPTLFRNNESKSVDASSLQSIADDVNALVNTTSFKNHFSTNRNLNDRFTVEFKIDAGQLQVRLAGEETFYNILDPSNTNTEVQVITNTILSKIAGLWDHSQTPINHQPNLSAIDAKQIETDSQSSSSCETLGSNSNSSDRSHRVTNNYYYYYYPQSPEAQYSSNFVSKEQFDALQSSYEKVLSELTELKGLYGNLISTLEKLQDVNQEIQANQTKNEELNQAKQKVESELQSTRKELETSKDNEQQLTTQVKDLETQKQELDRNLNDATTKNEELIALQSSLKKELEASRKENLGLSKEIDSLKLENAQLQKTIGELRRRIHELEGIESKYKEALATNSNLELEKATLEEENHDLRTDNSVLHGESSSLVKELTRLEKKFGIKTTRNRSFQEALPEFTEKKFQAAWKVLNEITPPHLMACCEEGVKIAQNKEFRPIYKVALDIKDILLNEKIQRDPRGQFNAIAKLHKTLRKEHKKLFLEKFETAALEQQSGEVRDFLRRIWEAINPTSGKI